jgi:hypothetical protein
MVSPLLILTYLGYLIFLVGFLVFSGFGLYHLEEYGYQGDFCRPMVVIYASVTAAIMLATVVSLAVSV